MDKRKEEIVIACFSKGIGGMEHDAVKLSKLLSQKYKISLLVKDGTYLHELALSLTDFEVNVVPFCFYSKAFSPSLLNGVSTFLNDNIQIRDFIFFGASEYKSLYWSIKNRSINFIIRHGTTKSRKKDSWYHRMIYKRVDWHVAISRHLEANIKEIIPLGIGTRIKVIYPSVITSGERTVRADDAIKIIHVGRVVRGKGQMDALKVAREMTASKINYKMEFVGGIEDQDYYQELVEYIHSNNISSNVSFVGQIEDVGEFYKKSDIFLYPSHGEGFGNVMAEALCYGLVCVCYSNTALKEFHDLGFYCHLINTGDVEQLKVKVVNCCHDLNRELRLSSDNVELGKKMFSTDNELLSWQDVIWDD